MAKIKKTSTKKKRKEVTTKARIVQALRQLWLRSNERATALKRDEYSCVKCGVKQSKAKGKEQKVTVDHIYGHINWDKVEKIVRQEVLVSPDKLQTLCTDCHAKKTKKDRENK